MRRASTSVSSNIADGFGRYSYREKIRFYYLVQGSLTELKNQLLIAKDIFYIDKNNFDMLANQANKTLYLTRFNYKNKRFYLILIS